MKDLIPIKYSNKLLNIFRNELGDIQTSLFISYGPFSNFHCIFSNMDGKYELGKELSPYKIPSLVRVMAKKANILSDDLLDELYNQTDDELLYIHEWGNDVKKIQIFTYDKETPFNAQKLNSILSTKKETLLELYNIIYQITYGEF